MAYDLNQDGYVDAGEIREKQPNIEQEDVSNYFMLTDSNEDGRISLDEYMQAKYDAGVVHWKTQILFTKRLCPA